jgi:phenylalanyl-tRNA synthetase beta chain
MKLSLRWLQRHVDLAGIAPRQILADLTMSTAEIEGLEPFGQGLEPLVVGHVVARERHPDADKLSVCMVHLGQGAPVQIVCGAPNVQKGQKVVVIRPGDTLPESGGKGALKIKVGRIRGVESHGMICSESELGLSAEQDGILVLPDGAEPGARFVDAVPVQDQVLEIDNKSINHRPDLWGHHGFARELAAIYGRELRPLPPPLPLPKSGAQIAVAIADRDACPRYCGLVVEGVAVTASPPELRYLLAAVGQRPINLPVDLTNFVMLDLGQPMHAFDTARLRGRSILVRMAADGERIATLDGQQRKLLGQDLLICSRAGDGPGEPVALAGIMGGEGTMVGEGTTSLFLESANFHAATVRRTSVRLGLRTDASARFEKAQDPANAELAVHHFLHLLRQYCPTARAAGPLVDPAGFRYEPRTIALRRARLDQKLGLSLPQPQVLSILRSLQFAVQETADGFRVAVPSFRATKDVTIEDDLIEEVGRMFRYDNIPERPLHSVVVPPPREDELFLVRRLLETAATELGACEAYNYTFVPDALLAAVGAARHQYAQVQNPVAPEIARVRRHVLPSLLGNLRANLRANLGDGGEVRLVEQGKGYHPEVRDEHGLPREVRELALLWSRSAGAHPYGELRQGVLQLLLRNGLPVAATRPWQGSDQPWVHPSMAVALDRDGSPVGYVAHLHPAVARALELPAATAIATVDVRALLHGGRGRTAFRALPTFPELPVDVALLVPGGARTHDVAEFLRRVGRKLVRDVRLFEVYRGEKVPAGRKSLNFTVVLGADDRTLTDEDERKFIDKVRAQATEIDAELRG